MKSKSKKVEGKTYFSKLNYNAVIKRLDSEGVSYKEVSLHGYHSVNIVIIKKKFGEFINYPSVNYFCTCGGRIKTDLYFRESIIFELVLSLPEN